MEVEKKAYFIDGDDLVFDLPDDAICFSSALASNLDVNKVDLDPSVNTQINLDAYDEIIDFYNYHREHFEIFDKKEGFNLWFFLNFRLYFEWRNHRLRLATIERFVETHPDGVVVTVDTELSSLFPNVQLGKSSPSSTPSPSKLKRIIQEFRYIFFAQGKNKSIDTDTAIISKSEDVIDNKNRRFHLLENEFSAIGVRSVFDMSNPLNKGPESFDQSLNINRILARYFRSFACIGNYRRISQSLNQLFSSIQPRNNEDKRILKLFTQHRSAYIVYHLIYQGFLKCFKGSKIKNILISDENSPQTRAIVEAAKKYDIKSFAFQHGTIHDLHPAYIFGKYKGKVPLPTKTFVWGSHYADLLSNSGGYDSSQVYASGRLPVYVRKTLNPKIDQRKTIVFATQPQRNPALRRKQLEDVMSVAKELSDTYQLVVRPHPRETADTYFVEIADSVGLSDFLIDRQSDLLSHFECCAVMITSFSTVGLEFIPYQKPMLVLDYMKEDLIGYIKNKVGVPIYNQADLLRVLSQENIAIDQSAFEKYLAQFNRPNPDIVNEIKQVIANPDR